MNLRKIYFATSNQNKIDEAKTILGIDIEGIGLDIDEIQSLDPIEVASKKALAYYDKVKKPIFIEEVALSFNALGRLPGNYIKDFYTELGNEGLCNLLKGKKSRTAVAQTTLVLIDNKGKQHVFIGKTKGRVPLKPKGAKGFAWDPIFIPDGAKRTQAEMELEEKNKYSMRAKAFAKMKAWMEKNKV